MRFPLLFLLVVGLLVFVAGCEDAKIVPVSGRVTLGKRPVANATVIFQPLSEEPNPGPGSQGKTDREGRFTLQLMTKDRKGALVGRHRVSITAYEGDEDVPSSGSDMVFRKRLIPSEYNVKSKLTFEVPAGGTSEADFDLPMPAPK
jgi:hypothetical protein